MLQRTMSAMPREKSSRMVTRLQAHMQKGDVIQPSMSREGTSAPAAASKRGSVWCSKRHDARSQFDRRQQSPAPAASTHIIFTPSAPLGPL